MPTTATRLSLIIAWCSIRGVVFDADNVANCSTNMTTVHQAKIPSNTKHLYNIYTMLDQR